MIFKGHKIIAFDTMFFIYHFEGNGLYKDRVGKVLQELEHGTIKGVTSVISLSEILVGPLADNNIQLADEYKNLLNSFPHLIIIEINQHIAVLAASLKAKYGIKLPDALQIASGLMGGADIFITNDKKLKKIKEIKVITFDKL